MLREWPLYRTVRDLVHAHVGRPAVVMGGGESLHPTLDLVADPARCVYISANDHGAKALRRRGRSGEALAYVLCLDRIEDRCRRELWADGKTGPVWGVPLVSRHMFADYRLLQNPWRDSGRAAAWLARLMGCDPIILAGIDCYSGGTYWHDKTAQSAGRFAAPRDHRARWWELFRASPAQYQASYGGLADALPPVDVLVAPRPKVSHDLCAELEGRWVEFTRPAELTGRPFNRGDVIEVKEAEAIAMVKRGDGRIVDPPA